MRLHSAVFSCLHTPVYPRDALNIARDFAFPPSRRRVCSRRRLWIAFNSYGQYPAKYGQGAAGFGGYFGNQSAAWHSCVSPTSRPPLAPPLAHLSPTSALQVRLTARRSAVRSPLRGPRAGAGGTSATISAISRLYLGCICCICDGPEQADVYYHCDQLIKVTVAPPALLAAALRPSSPPRLSPPLRGCTPPSSPSGKPTLRPSGCSSCRRASTLLARCGTPASCGAGCEQRLFTVSACGAGRPASCGAGSG